MGHHGLRSNHHACWLTATCSTETPGVGLQHGISFISNYHLPSEALGCQCKWCLGRSPLLRMGHRGERNHHHACRFIPSAQHFLVALAAALQQDTSFICKCQLMPEVLGYQCEWYLGRSPQLCRSTTVNRMQVQCWSTARYMLHIRVPCGS